MKQKNFLKIAFTLILAIFSIKNYSQSAGDIAFIAFNADGNDEFAFVALADIPANTSIWFTDNEWDGTDRFNNTGEGEIEWTYTSILPAGSVVVIAGNSGGNASIVSGVGTVSGNNLNLGASNESLYALLSEPISNTAMANPGFLAGISNDLSGDGVGLLTNTGLTLGTNFINFADDADGYKYTGARNGEAAFSDYLPLIMNTANWQIESSDGTLILPIDTTAFSTGAASPGITLGAVSNNTSEDGTTATFTVVLNTQPTTDVLLNLTSGDTGEVTLDLATLTFTNGNWDTPQTVTATGVDDAIQDGSVDVTITVAVDDANSDDAYDPIADVTTTITNEDNELPNLVINEFLADPDETNGDANGDGSVSTSQDEFIEIYNASGGELNIGGYTIEDSAGLRHTFPKGTILPTAGSIVVFGGGTPTNIPSLTQTASVGFLGLNNGGDTITIKDAAGTTVTSYTYGAEGGNNIALARNPDLTGSFVTHDNVTGNGAVLFSPGRDNTDNTGFYNTWSGTTNNDWSTATNWIDSDNPSAASDNVYIPGGLTNYPTASSAVTVNATFIGSGASLIAQSTYAGTVYYHRTLGTTNWYLVSSPVGGEIMTDMRANNDFASGTAPNIGFAPYDNSQASPNDRWDYFANTATTALADGKGYTIKLASDGNVTFAGSMNVSDFTSLNLSDNSGGSGNAFNLMGNPYPSFISISSLLSANDSGGNDLLTESTIWIWNEGTSTYDQRNSATAGANAFIAPGQGFFVSADGASTTFNITEAMQSHGSGESFQKNSRPEIKLFLSDESKTRKSEIYYINGTTTSFDNGYDSSIFGGITNDLEIYTENVANNVIEQKLGIQSLPDSNYKNMVIPIGVIAESGKEITFTVEVLNLPSGIKVYLEDRVNNTVTRLDETNSNYKATLNTALNGTGRFYLHTRSSALSTDDVALEGVSVYTVNKNTLRISGVNTTQASVKIYTILGKQVLNYSFSSKGNSDITLPNLNTGVYIVQLTTEKGKISKKIVLE